jgi:hypothetical protein
MVGTADSVLATKTATAIPPTPIGISSLSPNLSLSIPPGTRPTAIPAINAADINPSVVRSR